MIVGFELGNPIIHREPDAVRFSSSGFFVRCYWQEELPEATVDLGSALLLGSSLLASGSSGFGCK